MKDVEKVLRRACKQTQDGGVDLFKFVLHPTSFSETVRHLFLTSFLVKEKKAAIVIKDGEPYIFHGKSGGQLIFTLTKSQWEKLVKKTTYLKSYKILQKLLLPLDMSYKKGKGVKW